MRIYDRIGIRIWISWDNGRLQRIRYAIGHVHERLFGYEPESNALPYRVAHFLGLSGYAPSREGWAKRFADKRLADIRQQFFASGEPYDITQPTQQISSQHRATAIMLAESEKE